MNPLLLAGVGAATAWAMKRRFENRLERDIRALASMKATPSDPATLPAALRQAVERAMAEQPDASPLVRVAQHGRLRRRAGDAWSPYEATLYIALGHAGHAWHAHLSRLGWVAAQEVESLVFGVARSESRLFGAIPVEADAGAHLVRAMKFDYLAELPWIPQAFGANPGLIWSTTDDAQVLGVSVSDGEEPVRLELELSGSGDIVRARGMRPRLGVAGWTDAAWSREYGDHALLGGVRVPRHAETRWEGDPSLVWRRTHVTALAPASQP